jgi:hypothetical protein
MKFLLVVLFLSTNFMALHAQALFEVQEDPKEKGIMHVGQITDSILKASNYSWYKVGIKAYKTDSTYINALSKYIKDYTFIVFAGTWCEDTQHLLPQFMATIHQLKADDLVTIYGVDRNKKSLYMETSIMEITNVPTIIIKKGPREIGRIVETLTKDKLEQEIFYLIETDKESWKH